MPVAAPADDCRVQALDALLQPNYGWWANIAVTGTEIFAGYFLALVVGVASLELDELGRMGLRMLGYTVVEPASGEAATVDTSVSVRDSTRMALLVIGGLLVLAAILELAAHAEARLALDEIREAVALAGGFRARGDYLLFVSDRTGSAWSVGSVGRAGRERGAGRPTKRERREIDRFFS